MGEGRNCWRLMSQSQAPMGLKRCTIYRHTSKRKSEVTCSSRKCPSRSCFTGDQSSQRNNKFLETKSSLDKILVLPVKQLRGVVDGRR